MISGCFLRKKNDLQVRKIISFQFRNDFLHKKMISKELKNDFHEMIFGTFCAGFEDVIYSWEKKSFPSEMGISGNEWKSFFSRKCSTTSEKSLPYKNLTTKFSLIKKQKLVNLLS